MGRRLVIACAALSASCGPAFSPGAEHPASPSAIEAPAPSLATALTGDPAPPPEDVEAAARSYAADGDVGVRPPVHGIATHQEGTPLPSREPGVAEGEHGGHGQEPPAEPTEPAEGGDHAHH